jgi:hypothetical protein
MKHSGGTLQLLPTHTRANGDKDSPNGAHALRSQVRCTFSIPNASTLSALAGPVDGCPSLCYTVGMDYPKQELSGRIDYVVSGQ